MATRLTLAIAALLAATWSLQAQPTQISIELLTPDSQGIAGDTLVAVVQIRDANGLVAGIWCDTARYVDSLAPPPYSSVEQGPTLLLSEATSWLAPTPAMAEPLSECFSNGVDTVRFVYRRARTAIDTLYRVSVAMGGLTASTRRFPVLPGPMSRLSIESLNYSPIPDTITLDAALGESRVLFSRSYDRFGNRRGDEACNWTTTGSLHAIPGGANGTRIFYETSAVTYDEKGNIIATAVDSSAGRVADSVCVVVVGPLNRLVEAITADTNGNGYLDGVRLRFERPLALPSTPDSLARLLRDFGLDYQTVSWSVAGIRAIHDSTPADSTVLFVSLCEDTITALGQAQTGWTPYISLANWPQVGDISSGALTCSDGAGPVIGWAQVHLAPCSSIDTFYITFSERVAGAGGRPLRSIPPDSLFVVFDGCADTSHEVTAPFGGSARTDTVYDVTIAGQLVTSIRFVAPRLADTSLHCQCRAIRTYPRAMVVDYPAGNPTAVGNRRVSGGMIGIMDYPCPPTDTTSNVSNKDSGCGCGAGTGTALLPPLFFSAGAWWRRRKKKHDAARA